MPSPLDSENYDVVRGFARRVWVNQARLTLELRGPGCRERKSLTAGGNGGAGGRAGSGSMITRSDTVRVRSLCDQGDF
jgi:hypothetical protein